MTTTTSGRDNVPFTALVADTIATHGLTWACRYYYKRLPAWEARFFIRAALGV